MYNDEGTIYLLKTKMNKINVPLILFFKFILLPIFINDYLLSLQKICLKTTLNILCSDRIIIIHNYKCGLKQKSILKIVQLFHTKGVIRGRLFAKKFEKF